MSVRLAELAEAVKGELRGDGDRPIEGVATLESAGATDLSFLSNQKYKKLALGSGAGAILVAPGVELPGKDLLVVPDPYLALAQVLGRLHPVVPPEPGIHATAVIEDSAEIADSASVGAFTVVGRGSKVADQAVLHPAVIVGRDCEVGRDSVIHSHAVLYAGTILKERVVLHAGVVLGSDGFGYATHEGVHHKIPQIGRVVVESDVEIGANTTIDRAALDETRIGRGTKIDNLVQVGHNVRTGEGCLLVSQVGISGSTRLGSHVVMAGRSGAAGHLEIGDGATVAATSVVFRSVAAGEAVAGTPARDARGWRRQQAVAARLTDLRSRLRKLEFEIKRLHEGSE